MKMKDHNEMVDRVMECYVNRDIMPEPEVEIWGEGDCRWWKMFWTHLWRLKILITPMVDCWKEFFVIGGFSSESD